MPHATVVIDGRSYDVDEHVAQRIAEYYRCMEANYSTAQRLYAELQALYADMRELAIREQAAKFNACKDNRLAAWEAKKRLLSKLPHSYSKQLDTI